MCINEFSCPKSYWQFRYDYHFKFETGQDFEHRIVTLNQAMKIIHDT